jgi:MFS family permease
LLAPKPIEDTRYILILSAVVFLFALMIFSDRFFTKNVYLVAAAFAVCAVIVALTAHRAFTLLKHRNADAEDGYFTTEQGFKGYKRSRRYTIIIFVLGAAFLIALSVMTGVLGIEQLMESSTAYLFPLVFTSLGSMLLNSAGGGGAVAFVVFRDNRFTVAGYVVPYEGLTLTRTGSVTDPAAKWYNAVFWKDGREVGHDILYREDYLYLSGILEAFARHGEVATCDDPFYSEVNLKHLRASMAQLDAGLGKEHELIEVDEEFDDENLD